MIVIMTTIVVCRSLSSSSCGTFIHAIKRATVRQVSIIRDNISVKIIYPLRDDESSDVLE